MHTSGYFTRYIGSQRKSRWNSSRGISKVKSNIKEEGVSDQSGKKADAFTCASEPSCWEEVPAWVSQKSRSVSNGSAELCVAHYIGILRRVLGIDSGFALGAPKVEPEATLKREFPESVDDTNPDDNQIVKRIRARPGKNSLGPGQTLMTQFIR